MRAKKPLIGLLAVVLALTMLGVLPAPAAHAADIRIVVSSTADLPDSDPGDRKCENKGLFNTGCSLRAAIWDDRIFDIRETVTAELRSLEIVGGNVTSAAGTLEELGGGVKVDTDASVELNNTVVRSNRAVRGGVVVRPFGILTLIGGTIRGNDATRGGGGIVNAGRLDADTGTNAIQDNTADSGEGGDILNESGATAILAGASIRRNRVLGHDDEGGGVLNKGTLTITAEACWTTPPSPAVDAGSPLSPGSGGAACERTDQLGAQRPLDGDGDGRSRCDIGAVERQPPASGITGQVGAAP